MYCDIAHVISDIVHLYYSVADWTVCSSVNGSACEHKCDKVKIHFIIFFNSKKELSTILWYVISNQRITHLTGCPKENYNEEGKMTVKEKLRGS